MAGLFLYLVLAWGVCLVLRAAGLVLIAWGARNLRQELGGGVMLVCGIVLAVLSAGFLVLINSG